jgi:hypothetical protein
MTRLCLVDLPLELLHDILEILVVIVGFKHALPIRLVNSWLPRSLNIKQRTNISVGLFFQGIMAVFARPGTVNFCLFTGLHALEHREIISGSLFYDILRYRLSHSHPSTYHTATYAGDVEKVTRTAEFLVKESASQLPKYQVQYSDALYALFTAESYYELPNNQDRDLAASSFSSSQETNGVLLLDALIAAAYLGNVAMVQHLLKEGADLNRHWDRARPVVQAASQGHFEIFQLLLEYGAEVDTHEPGYDRHPYTSRVLNRACSNGHLEIVKLLLDRPTFLPKLKLDEVMNLISGQVLKAAIKCAAKGGHRSVIEVLVQRMEREGYEPFKDHPISTPFDSFRRHSR